MRSKESFAFRLRVHGSGVRRPLDLSYRELRALVRHPVVAV
jgi:hypothetical protein